MAGYDEAQARIIGDGPSKGRVTEKVLYTSTRGLKTCCLRMSTTSAFGFVLSSCCIVSNRSGDSHGASSSIRQSVCWVLLFVAWCFNVPQVHGEEFCTAMEYGLHVPH